MITNIADLLPPIRQLHEQIRDSLVAAAESTSPDELAQIAKEETGDKAEWTTEVAVPTDVQDLYIMLSVESKKQRLFVNYAIDVTDK